MDGQQQHSSDSPAATGVGVPHLFHALGPALLISIGYIDLGKWVAAVEAGSRFGFDLVLLALLVNFMAILCQYLAACIGTVTGRSLAEICHQEYSKQTCIFLGVQAGLSLLTSELMMIFGIALGFNLLFEYDDLITGICFATVVPNLLPYAISHLGKKMAGTLNACIAGFALLCYVLGLLVSQPQIPLTTNVIFPKLSGESAYSLMALLGANIMAHNFYIHSSVVQIVSRLISYTMAEWLLLPTSIMLVQSFTIGALMLFKIAFNVGMAPFVLLAYRNLIGALIVLPFAFWFER